MYPIGFGPRIAPQQTQEELDFERAIADSLIETTHHDYGYGQSTSTEHQDPELAAALEASRLEAEKARRQAEQTQFESMSRYYHQLPPTVSSPTPPSATKTLSEADQIHLATLFSQYEQQQAQKSLQEQQEELARLADLSRSSYYPQPHLSVPPLPYTAYPTYPSAQSTYYSSTQPTYPSTQPTYPSTQPTYPSTQPSYYPSTQTTYPSTQPLGLPPTLPSSSIPSSSFAPMATSAKNDDELRQAERLSLLEQQEAERLREQQRRQEEEELAAVLRRSEMDNYSTFPHQMGDPSYQLRPAFPMPQRAAAPSATSTQCTPTLEQAVTNAQSISKLRFIKHEISRNDVGNPYLVLNYASSMHRMLAVEELRGTYHMFSDGKDPQGGGTSQLILSVEQTKEFQSKLG